MSSQLELHENWIRDYLKPRHPHLVEAFYAALMGYDYIQGSQKAENPALDFIVHAARSPRALLFGTATRLLADLTIRHNEARQAVLEMLLDKNWRTRCNALLCLKSRTPRRFMVKVIKTGLNDKSARVRALAAHQAWQWRLRALIPNLERLVTDERNQRAQKDIEFHLHLLRDGYALVPFDDELDIENNDEFMLWISTSDGMRGSPVSQREIDNVGIPELVMKLCQE